MTWQRAAGHPQIRPPRRVPVGLGMLAVGGVLAGAGAMVLASVRPRAIAHASHSSMTETAAGMDGTALLAAAAACVLFAIALMLHETGGLAVRPLLLSASVIIWGVTIILAGVGVLLAGAVGRHFSGGALVIAGIAVILGGAVLAMAGFVALTLTVLLLVPAFVLGVARLGAQPVAHRAEAAAASGGLRRSGVRGTPQPR